MLRQSCANGTRTERAVQGREPGSIPVRTAIDVARVGPMAGDVTALKKPQLLGFSSLSQSSLRRGLRQLHEEVESLSMLQPKKRKGEKKNGPGGKNRKRRHVQKRYGSSAWIENSRL